MDTYILSIGLNVGTAEPSTQLAETLAQVQSRFGPVRAVAMLAGEWEGVRERTLHVAILADVKEVARGVPALCRGLRQECIAVTWPGAAQWLNIGTAGARLDGGTVADFPVAIAAEIL